MTQERTSSDTLASVKPLRFCPGSHDELMRFPKAVIKEAGYQLDQVQKGMEADDSKPYPRIDTGVMQLSVDVADGWFRVMYVVKFPEAIYILHCFEKKSNATPKKNINVAEKRLSKLIADRSKGAKK